MKAAKRNLMVGTVAAAVLVGGAIAGILHNQAYADSAAPAVTNQGNGANVQPGGPQGGPAGQWQGQQVQGARGHGPNGRGPGGHRPGGQGQRGQGPDGGRGPGAVGDLAQDTATILGVDVQAVHDATQQGKTLAQIAQDKAGLSEDAFLQKLTAAAEQHLADQVTAGKLTQAQADQIKSGLADRLKQEVEETHPNGPGPDQRGHGGPEGMFGGPDAVATILGITTDELKADQQAGKSLADIAADKGVNEDQLIAKLKDAMTDNLKQYVENKGGPMHGGAPANQPQSPAPATSPAPSQS